MAKWEWNMDTFNQMRTDPASHAAVDAMADKLVSRVAPQHRQVYSVKKGMTSSREKGGKVRASAGVGITKGIWGIRVESKYRYLKGVMDGMQEVTGYSKTGAERKRVAYNKDEKKIPSWWFGDKE